MPKPATSPSGRPRQRITVRIDPALLPSNTDWGEDFSPLIERLLYAEMERSPQCRTMATDTVAGHCCQD